VSARADRYRRGMSTDLRVPLTQRLRSRTWVLLDSGFAVLLLVFTIFVALGARRQGDHFAIRREPGDPVGATWDALRYLAVFVACVSLPFRRRWPGAVLAVTATCDAVLLALGVHGPVQIAVALALYSAAVASPRRLPVGTLGAVVAATLLGALIAPDGPEWAAVIAGPAVVLMGWFAGENVRARRAYAQGVAERTAEREREREERVRQAATDERVRIARELHDIVAHTMSLIAVRAGAARVVIDQQPDDAREALSIIETTSRRALREMRRLVGVLRQPDDTSDADLEPAPRLADLDDLVRQTDQAGVHVDLEITGHVRPLPPGVDVSAYRIVQEALTNVVRHAGPTNAHLRIRYQSGGVDIELVDDGTTARDRPAPPRRPAGSGHGLVGMRERVALYRGELIAEPTSTGYRVLARLPIDDERR
jgi:signal transduction histidine kinase